MDVTFSTMQSVMSNSNSPTDVLRHNENNIPNASPNAHKNPLNYSQVAFANNNIINTNHNNSGRSNNSNNIIII